MPWAKLDSYQPTPPPPFWKMTVPAGAAAGLTTLMVPVKSAMPGQDTVSAWQIPVSPPGGQVAAAACTVPSGSCADPAPAFPPSGAPAPPAARSAEHPARATPAMRQSTVLLTTDEPPACERSPMAGVDRASPVDS